MTMHDDSDLQLLERDLRRLAEPQPQDERVRLAVRRQLAAQLRPRRQPRRLPVRIAVGASAAVAAMAAIALVIVIGTGSSGGPSVADAAIIHHALRAVTPPANQILHTKLVGMQNGVPVANEVWRQTAPPYAGRAIKDREEFSNNGTTWFEYDPATNTIYQHPGSPPPPSDPVAQVRQELASGQAQVNGTVVIDGASLYKIDLPHGLVGYFDTRNYAPRYLDNPQRDGTVIRLRFAAYEYLPMTSSNRGLLSVTAQHPSARIDTNPNDAPAGSAIK
jgi:hypothetical protein